MVDAEFRHSGERRNPVESRPGRLDSRFRGNDDLNVPSAREAWTPEAARRWGVRHSGGLRNPAESRPGRLDSRLRGKDDLSVPECEEARDGGSSAAMAGPSFRRTPESSGEPTRTSGFPLARE
jgi:hypothetical protein